MAVGTLSRPVTSFVWMTKDLKWTMQLFAMVERPARREGAPGLADVFGKYHREDRIYLDNRMLTEKSSRGKTLDPFPVFGGHLVEL